MPGPFHLLAGQGEGRFLVLLLSSSTLFFPSLLCCISHPLLVFYIAHCISDSAQSILYVNVPLLPLLILFFAFNAHLSQLLYIYIASVLCLTHKNPSSQGRCCSQLRVAQQYITHLICTQGTTCLCQVHTTDSLVSTQTFTHRSPG